MQRAPPRSRQWRPPIEDRDQHFQALRSARVGRKDGRRKANALRSISDTVAHPWAAHGDRANAGHDLAFRQMSMAHQSLVAIIGRLVGIPAEQGCDFGLDSLRQKRSRTVAQHLGQRINKTSWLGKLENVSLGHGVSLLCWRSGGVEHPHDTPPYSFTPSPTFAIAQSRTANAGGPDSGSEGTR